MKHSPAVSWPIGGLILCLSGHASAQGWGWGGPPGSSNGGGPGGPWGGPWGGSGSNPNGNNGGANGQPQSASAFATLQSSNSIVIAHGVLAALAWVLFIPTGAILLRLNIKSPVIVRLHAICQSLAYLLYFVAAAMGIMLVQRFSSFVNLWRDPHPVIGMVILVAAFVQLWIGAANHSRYKKRLQAGNAGSVSSKPGRSSLGRTHVWLGRILIVLAMINGGLGLRLARKSGTQSASGAKNIQIIYAVLAGWMFLLYAGITWSHQTQAKKVTPVPEEVPRYQEFYGPKGGLPTYDESEESSQHRN